MEKLLFIPVSFLLLIAGCTTRSQKVKPEEVKAARPLDSEFDIEFRGMSYTPWARDVLSTQRSHLSLEKTLEAGCNWIALNVWMFQDDVKATEIDFDYSKYSASPESLVDGIKKIHSLGMKVLLKPNIDNRTGVFRGEIIPSTGWFAKYKEVFTFWAQFATENNVDMLSVGCELVNTTSRTDQWRDVIRTVKENYSGPLTYSANHGNEQKVKFWDQLDYIGIDAYYPLTNKNDPTLEELKVAWKRHLDTLDRWLAADWPDKPLIFTELGYQSRDGSNKTPWWVESETLDLQEQVDCYEALLSQVSNYDWWKGIFWWNWETNPWAGGEYSKEFTPQRKPAEEVIKKYYQAL